jgi:hypothetical protein
MPVTLGSNSISGLAAGGLPTGSVAAADLAGSIPNTYFSAGRELNYAIVRSNTDTNINTTAFTDFNSTTYTPVSTSSYVYVWVHTQLWQGSSATMSSGDAHMRLLVTGGSYASATEFYINNRVAGNFAGTGSQRLHSHFNSVGRFTNSDTSTKTITMQGRYTTTQSTALSWGHGIQIMYFFKEVLR